MSIFAYRGGAACSAALSFRPRARPCGCASLPSSGPTGTKSGTPPCQARPISFTVVEVETPAAIPPAPLVPASVNHAAAADRPARPGDVLNISVYEAGVSLFGTALRTAAAAEEAIDTSSTAERLPAVGSTTTAISRCRSLDASRGGTYRGRAAADDPERSSRNVAGSAGHGHDRAIDHQQRHPRGRNDKAGATGTGYQPQIAVDAIAWPAAIVARPRTRWPGCSATARLSKSG